MPAFELASYEPEHRDDYLGLLREAGGERTMSPAEFDWWVDGNPTGNLRSVACVDGRVVGVAAHSLVRMVLDGQERTAAFSVHATTHASARGQGIFAELERKHEREATDRDVAVVLAFASAPTAPIFLGPLGWTEIARYRVWLRPLLSQAAAPARSEPFEVSADTAGSWPNHVVRDAAYLNWRFADSPRGYRIVPGHAVVGRTDYRGIETAVLADFVGDSRALLRRAVAASAGRLL